VSKDLYRKTRRFKRQVTRLISSLAVVANAANPRLRMVVKGEKIRLVPGEKVQVAQPLGFGEPGLTRFASSLDRAARDLKKYHKKRNKRKEYVRRFVRHNHPLRSLARRIEETRGIPVVDPFAAIAVEQLAEKVGETPLNPEHHATIGGHE